MSYFPIGDPPPYWSIYPWGWCIPNWPPPPPPITYGGFSCMGTNANTLCPHRFEDPPDIETIFSNKKKLWGSFEKLKQNKISFR